MGVLVERIDAACVVTMDWPAQRNALGPDEAEELVEGLREAAGTDAMAVVLAGTGVFSAGGNLPVIAALAEQGPEAVRANVYGKFQETVRTLVSIPVPTIAALDGPAIGLGFDLALACDMRFSGPKGWCRQGWGTIGLIPATGGELLLRRRAPNLLWALLAEQPKLEPATLARHGIAEAVDGSAVEAAVERARQLAGMPREALEGYVAISRHGLQAELDSYLATCLEFQVDLICSDHFHQRAAELLGR